MSKEATSKKKVKKENNNDFLNLAKDLKDIVLDHNKRLSEVESLIKKIAQRMGLWI